MGFLLSASIPTKASILLYDEEIITIEAGSGYEMQTIYMSNSLKTYMQRLKTYPTREYNEMSTDVWFANTFSNLNKKNTEILGLTLEISLKPVQTEYSINFNDTISIAFMGDNCKQLHSGWFRQIGTSKNISGILDKSWASYPDGYTISLDFSALPEIDGTFTNLLDSVNQNGFFDLMVQNDTAVENIRLIVKRKVEFASLMIQSASTACKTNEILIPITLNCKDDVDIQGINLEIQYDHSVLLEKGVKLSGKLLENQENMEINTNVLGNGNIGIAIASSTSDQITQGIIVYLVFNVIGDPGISSELSFARSEINEQFVKGYNGIFIVNYTPVAQNFEIHVTEDKTIIGNLIAGDTDNDELSYQIIEKPHKGEINLIAQTGEYEYIPDADENGIDHFTYMVYDGSCNSESATVSITILPECDPPIISDISDQRINACATESISFSITDKDNDDYLSYTAFSDNPTLVNTNNIIIDCYGASCEMKITPTPYMSGETNITLIASDACDLTNSSKFQLTVHNERIKLGPDFESHPGSQISVPVMITENIAIKMIKLVLKYDNDIFEIINAGFKDSDLENRDYHLKITDLTEGSSEFTISAKDETLIYEGDGTLAFIQFKIKENLSGLPLIENVAIETAEINQHTICSSNLDISVRNPTLSGKITYFTPDEDNNEKPVSDAIISISGTGSYTTISDESGQYFFKDVRPGDIVVNVSKFDNSKEGLSAMDISKILRMIPTEDNNNCYENIAADTNLSGKITGLDVSKLSRYQLEFIDIMNDQSLTWICIPESSLNCSQWPPISFETDSKLTPFSKDVNNHDFECIKLGDITGNFGNKSNVAKDKRQISTYFKRDTVDYSPDESAFSMPIMLDEFLPIEGMDIIITYDSDMLNPKDILLTNGILEYQNYEMIVNTDLAGQIKIIIYSQNEILKANGIFAFINFEIIDSNKNASTLSIDTFQCNEQTTSGGFYVEGAIYHHVNIIPFQGVIK